MHGSGQSYGQDPLLFLERAFRAEGDLIRLPEGLCVADPDLARDILHNRSGYYREHSDFFAIRAGMFGPRSAQLEIDRGCRLLLERYHAASRPRLPDLVERMLARGAPWPDAGNLLLFDYAGDALLAPDSPGDVRATVRRVVDRAVLAGARNRRPAPVRAVFRRRVISRLAAAIEHRRSLPAKDPDDLLDVVVLAAPPGASATDLAEVFLGLLFAVVGSIGFVLGWCVHLLGTHRDLPPTEPGLVVREALRLWPVAWLFGRTAARPHRLGPASVQAGDPVLVCGYLAHRHPGHWPDPDQFRPQRWAAASSFAAYLPFGSGPHSCPSAGVAVRIVEDILGVLTTGFELAVGTSGDRPQVGPALAPPQFRLRATRRAVPTSGPRR